MTDYVSPGAVAGREVRDSIRTADETKANLAAIEAKILADPKLSPEGRQEVLAKHRADAAKTIDRLRDQADSAETSALDAYESRAWGPVPSWSSDQRLAFESSFLDQSDRARDAYERLGLDAGSDRALAMFADARAVGSVARMVAVAWVAAQQGGRSSRRILDAFAKELPDRADALRQIADIQHARKTPTMRMVRSRAFSPIGPGR